MNQQNSTFLLLCCLSFLAVAFESVSAFTSSRHPVIYKFSRVNNGMYMVQDGLAQWDDSQRLNNKSKSRIPGIITEHANGNRSRDTKDPTVAFKKDTVNGMFDYQTAFADRIGGAHDKDDWNANPVNGVCVYNRQRSQLAVPTSRKKNAVNSMFNNQISAQQMKSLHGSRGVFKVSLNYVSLNLLPLNL